jgi:hypothetical protein
MDYEKMNLEKLVLTRDKIIQQITEKKLEYMAGFLGGEDFVRKHSEVIKEIIKVKQEKGKDNWIDFYFYSDKKGFENIGINLEGIYEGTFCIVDTRNSFLSDLLDRRDALQIIDLLEK